MSVDIFAEPLEIVMDRRLCFLWLSGGDERAGLELLVVAEATLEPDRELARHPELMQRLAMVPCAFVDSGVPDTAQVVKKGPLQRADDVAVPEAVNELLLPLVGADEQAHLGSRPLREHLAELAELEQRDRGISPEMLLGLRGERGEARVVVRQVCEIRGRGRVQG